MAQPIWNTASGSIGTFPSGVAMVYQLSASAVLPAVSVTYAVISGSLPNGVTMDEDGLIAGIPTLVTSDVSYTFVVRATDNYANLRDRTFTITTSGAAVPQFTTPTGTITTTFDSTWIETPIEYSNPVATNPVSIRLIQGQLPPAQRVVRAGHQVRPDAEPGVPELRGLRPATHLQEHEQHHHPELPLPGL